MEKKLPNFRYFFAGIFLISPCVWPNSGYWCCLFLTLLRISLLPSQHWFGWTFQYAHENNGYPEIFSSFFLFSDLWFGINCKHPKKNLAIINDTFFQKLFKQSEFGGKLFQNGKQYYKMVKSSQNIYKIYIMIFFLKQRISCKKEHSLL